MIHSREYNTVQNIVFPREKGQGLKITWIYLMITSYFVVVPLGSLTTVTSTDLRLYDVVFLFGFLFIILPNLKKIFAVIKANHWVRNYFQLTIWLTIGLLIVIITKNLTLAIIGAARIARFVSYGFVAAIILTYVNDKRTLYRLIWLFFLLSVAEAVLSMLQFLNVVPNLFPSRWDYYGQMPTGTLGPHHLQMGIVCIMAICMGISLAFLHRSFLIRVFITLSIALLVFASFAVESRTGLVGIAIGLIYLFIRLLRKMSFNLIFLYLILFVGGLIVVRNMNVAAEFQIQDITINKFYRPIESGGVEGLSTTRFALAKDLPEVLWDNPWVLISGTGTQNAAIVLHYGNALHNNYLHVLVEGGILGLVLYLRMLISILKESHLLSTGSTSERTQILTLGFQAAFIAILISNLYNESFYLQYATFSLSGQIMALAALCLNPAWINDLGPQPK